MKNALPKDRPAQVEGELSKESKRAFTRRLPQVPGLAFDEKGSASAVDEEIVRRKAHLKELVDASAQSFGPKDAQYRVLTGVRALPESEYATSDGEIVQTKAGQVFYEVPAGTTPREAGRPVVYDERTGSIGVLTGELVVRYASPTDAQTIARDYGLQLTQTFDQLLTTYYQATRSQSAELLELLGRLQKDKRVLEVSLHVLKNKARPQ